MTAHSNFGGSKIDVRPYAQNLPVHPGFPADLALLTIGYASVFVLLVFKRGEMYVERRDGRVA